MITIESYQPYHIGIKLADFVNLKTLKIQLIDSLRNKKYEIIKEKEILPLEKIREYIATKNKIKIQLFYPVIAINVIMEITKSHKEAIESFNDIINFLKELEYDLKKTVLFSEIVSNVVIKTDNKPIDILNKSLKVDLGTFEDLGRINSTGLKFRSGKNENEFLDLLLEPKLTSPESRYFLRIVYRTGKIENIDKFHNELEKNILNIMKSVEGD